MQIYLPVAEVPVNIWVILALGMTTGFLAGLFGIGGGFLATPLLMFIGIPPAIAVSTSANQITASSFSGLLAHLKKGNVDIKMGMVLLSGGMVGSLTGVSVLKALQKSGQAEVVIPISYVLCLGTISVLMLIDSGKAVLEKKYNISWESKGVGRLGRILAKMKKWPFRTHFPKSAITVSALVPIAIGFIVGMLVAMMGIGGGFIMVPAMIYILRMSSNVVVGTSLFEMVFISGNTTFLQAIENHTVDIALAFLMIISSVIGAQFGTRAIYKIDADRSRLILSLIIFGFCTKMLFGLFEEPASLYFVELLDAGFK